MEEVTVSMPLVTVSMPLHLTHDLLMAVRNNDLTKCEDKDEMNTRIGWLICAYDAMVEARTNPPSPFDRVPNGTELSGKPACGRSA